MASQQDLERKQIESLQFSLPGLERVPALNHPLRSLCRITAALERQVQASFRQDACDKRNDRQAVLPKVPRRLCGGCCWRDQDFNRHGAALLPWIAHIPPERFDKLISSAIRAFVVLDQQAFDQLTMGCRINRKHTNQIWLAGSGRNSKLPISPIGKPPRPRWHYFSGE